MGQFGRITAVSDLPPRKVLADSIKAAMALNDAGVKPERPKRSPKPPVSAPAEWTAEGKDRNWKYMKPRSSRRARGTPRA